MVVAMRVAKILWTFLRLLLSRQLISVNYLLFVYGSTFFTFVSLFRV
jgi:hypothetical protein